MPLLFVYGTLAPGHAPACVADLVARFRTVGRAAVRGTLYDCGDYPGLVLGGDRDVRGYVVEVPDDPLLLRRLDAYEGFDAAAPAASLFRRVSAVATLSADGRAVDCQTYVYNHPAAGCRTVPGGDWLRWADRLANRVSEPAPAAAEPVMPNRPVIGVTTGYCDDRPAWYESPGDYAASVARAGGLPLLVPFRTDLALVPDVVALFDGIVFTGGNDLDPALYGEPRHPAAVPLDPDRQRFELALLAEAERRQTPTLGVCLGCQLLNVHRGGSLTQFIPDAAGTGAVEHRHLGDHGYRHDVRVEPGSVLAAAVGRDRVSVNSRHKQAIARLGRGLRTNAVAPDGVVEGVEDPSLPLFLGVQWHPENLAATSAEHLAPFKKLVEVAAGRARR